MVNSIPCKMPDTRYIPHVLQPSQPNLAAKLPTHTKLPGDWMHIEGILKLRTSCNLHVVHICGKNCTAASIVPKTPMNSAHDRNDAGRANTTNSEIRNTIAK